MLIAKFVNQYKIVFERNGLKGGYFISCFSQPEIYLSIEQYYTNKWDC